jgi:hypothetical protein
VIAVLPFVEKVLSGCKDTKVRCAIAVWVPAWTEIDDWCSSAQAMGVMVVVACHVYFIETQVFGKQAAWCRRQALAC